MGIQLSGNLAFSYKVNLIDLEYLNQAKNTIQVIYRVPQSKYD